MSRGNMNKKDDSLYELATELGVIHRKIMVLMQEHLDGQIPLEYVMAVFTKLLEMMAMTMAYNRFRVERSIKEKPGQDIDFSAFEEALNRWRG
jgi:hypothetical protein